MTQKLERKWVEIPGHKGYCASRNGEILGTRKMGVLKQTIHPTVQRGGKYLHVELYVNGRRIHKAVHQLIARTFCQKERMDQIQVNHKNGVKTDNRARNLGWCSVQERIIHSIKRIGKAVVHRAVIQLDLDGKEIKRWDSVKQASDALGIGRSTIISCIGKKPVKTRDRKSGIKNRVTAGGFRWVGLKKSKSLWFPTSTAEEEAIKLLKENGYRIIKD